MLLSLIRMFIAMTFVFSVSGKFLDFSRFEEAIYNFSIVPRSAIRATAVLVILSEVSIPIFLLIGTTSTVALGFFASILLLALFTISLSRALRRGMHTSCACFGFDEKISRLDIVRNIGFLVASSIGLWSLSRHGNVPSTGILQWMFLGVASGIILAFWLNAGEIIKFSKS